MALSEKTDGAQSDVAVPGAHNVLTLKIDSVWVDGTVREVIVIAGPEGLIEVLDVVANGGRFEDGGALGGAAAVDAELVGEKGEGGEKGEEGGEEGGRMHLAC